MRLFVGAGLSMVDLASDIVMVVTYTNEGQEGTARSLLAMISACLLVQLWMVYMQTSGGPRRVMVKEILIVLSGIKPGVDAMRVASGAEQNEHSVIDPATELSGTRCAELICEAIPGAILQFTAAMRVRQGGGTVSNIAVASVVISALTTGYSSACISFDYDVDPVKRRNDPDYYVSRARRGLYARTSTLVHTHTPLPHTHFVHAHTQCSHSYILGSHAHMFTHTCSHTHVHAQMFTHKCSHTHVHPHVHTHMFTHTCSYTHVHTHMFTHTCSHTHVHTHTNTHLIARTLTNDLRRATFPTMRCRGH